MVDREVRAREELASELMGSFHDEWFELLNEVGIVVGGGFDPVPHGLTALFFEPLRFIISGARAGEVAAHAAFTAFDFRMRWDALADWAFYSACGHNESFSGFRIGMMPRGPR